MEFLPRLQMSSAECQYFTVLYRFIGESTACRWTASPEPLLRFRFWRFFLQVWMPWLIPSSNGRIRHGVIHPERHCCSDNQISRSPFNFHITFFFNLIFWMEILSFSSIFFNFDYKETRPSAITFGIKSLDLGFSRCVICNDLKKSLVDHFYFLY